MRESATSQRSKEVLGVIPQPNFTNKGVMAKSDHQERKLNGWSGLALDLIKNGDRPEQTEPNINISVLQACFCPGPLEERNLGQVDQTFPQPPLSVGITWEFRNTDVDEEPRRSLTNVISFFHYRRRERKSFSL